MSNRIFLNSSVLIEALKGNKINFYYSLVAADNNILCINSIVIIEYLYYLIGFGGGSSPRSLQQSGKLKEVLNNEVNQTKILSDFHLLEPDESISVLVPLYITSYNLLPNDAIILATCKIHGITRLASHDADFIFPCQQDKIELLTEIA